MSHQHHRFDPSRLAKLDDPARSDLFDIVGVLHDTGLTPGQTAVDFGTGSGFYLPYLCEAVGPRGKVYGLDLEPLAISHIRTKPEIAAFRQLALMTIDPAPAPFPFPDGCLDYAFLAFVFHEFDPIDIGLQELKRILHPGGRLTIIEWSKTERDKGPPADQVPSLPEILSALSRAGFVDPQVRDFPPYCAQIAALRP